MTRDKTFNVRLSSAEFRRLKRAAQAHGDAQCQRIMRVARSGLKETK